MRADTMVRQLSFGTFRSAVLSVVTCLSTVAPCNDTALSVGGTPRVWKNHPSVAMHSEVVRMTIGDEKVVVDCRFNFENLTSRPVTVQMGFPDVGYGASNPDQENLHNWRIRPPESTFDSFRSWVDGKEVPTKLVRSNKPGEFWHVKTVHFPPHAKRVVRNLYTQLVGFSGVHLSEDRWAWGHWASYVLHTGASWRGSIGRSEVIVTFRRKAMVHTLRPWRITSGQWPDGPPRRDWQRERGRVFYSGPSRPSVNGLTLRFVRKNWEPTLQDNIVLAFDPTPNS